MSWILQLLIEAGVLLLLAYIHPGVKVRSYGTALGVALVIGILNATIGLILRFSLNLVTLWLLSFFVRLFVSAIVIWLTDKLFSGFELRSFGTAVLVACILAIVGTLLAY
jgi:putative membrane protein